MAKLTELEAAQARNRIWPLAISSPAMAAEAARAIDVPWYRCQALAHAAWYVFEPDLRRQLVDEAFAAGMETIEPNRIVTVSSWALPLLCAPSEAGRLATEVERLLGIIASEPHPLRRLDALLEMLRHLIRGPQPYEPEVLSAFQDACSNSPAWRPCMEKIYGAFLNASRHSHGWRGDNRLRDAAILLVPVNPDWAMQVLDLIEQPKCKRQALRRTGLGAP